MNHAAIDLGGKESQICIRQADGTIIEERKVPTRKLTELVATWAPSRVVMETSAEAFKVADAALVADHQVHVVPASLVRLLGVNERGVKNDQRDAQQLSKASWRTDVPSVHIPSKPARELKSICGARDVLVGTRTKLINNVRGWTRTQLWKLRGGTTGTFADRVRGHAASLSEPLPEHIERQLRMLSVVIEEVKAADKQLQTLAGEHEVCRRLMTVPGIGPVTAVRFVAAIDEPGRLATAHHVRSYLGLTPSEHSGSERERRTGITKAGSMELRCTLIQAAWAAMYFVRTSHPMIDWARRLAERRGRPVAAVALARKLAGILFAMWRDGTTYQAQRSCGGNDAQLAVKSAYAANSANPDEGCPKAASAITWFRGRRFPTTIWAVRLRRRPRTHCCAPSANSRLRQPDTFWTHHTRVDTTDPNRGLRLGADLCLFTRPLHSQG